jgi:hypothetical protein
MKKKELKVLVEDLTEKLRVVTMEPDSPEAKVITLQMMFAEQVRNAMDTGQPIDTPMLLGVFGRMMYPAQLEKAKEPLWPVPKNVEELKEMLLDFFSYMDMIFGPFPWDFEDINYVEEFLKDRPKDE